jgi:hypothetical protein
MKGEQNFLNAINLDWLEAIFKLKPDYRQDYIITHLLDYASGNIITRAAARYTEDKKLQELVEGCAVEYSWSNEDLSKIHKLAHDKITALGFRLMNIT